MHKHLGLILTCYVLFFNLASAAQECSQVFANTKNSSSILNLKNIISWQQSVLKSSRAEKYINTTVKKDLNYTFIKTDQRRKLTESDLFNDKSDFILGIDTEGHTRGHVYMIINDVRVDGHILFAAQTETKTKWELSNGLFIRYKGLSAEGKQQLIDWINSDNNTRGMTCVAVACKLLFDKAGLNGPRKSFWFPSEILEYVLNNESSITRQNTASIEFYTINYKAEYVLRNLPKWSTLPKLFFMLFDPRTWGF